MLRSNIYGAFLDIEGVCANMKLQPSSPREKSNFTIAVMNILHHETYFFDYAEQKHLRWISQIAVIPTKDMTRIVWRAFLGVQTCAEGEPLPLLCVWIRA